MRVKERSYSDLTIITAEDVGHKIGSSFWKAEFKIKGDICDVTFNSEQGVFEILNTYEVDVPADDQND